MHESLLLSFVLPRPSQLWRMRVATVVVSDSLDLAQGAMHLVTANCCNSTRATQLVHADGKLRTRCQKEGSCGGRKDGKIQRGFHSQSHRHRDREYEQENSAQQGGCARVPSNHKAQA